MFDNDKLAQKNGTSATIRMSDWFKLTLMSLITIIPLVGLIVYIILLLKIGFGGNTSPSIKNYVLLQLILSAIVLLVAAILIALCMPAIINGGGSSAIGSIA